MDDALRATRSILFDETHYDVESKAFELIHFTDARSQFAHMDRTIVDTFDRKRQCMIRRMLSDLDEGGRSALHIAAIMGNAPLIMYLLLKAREVWYWPNIRRFVLNEVIFQDIKSKLSIGGDKKNGENQTKASTGRFEHINVRIFDSEFENLEMRKILMEDVDNLKKMFFEPSMSTTLPLKEMKSAYSGTIIRRNDMIKLYSRFLGKEFENLRFLLTKKSKSSKKGRYKHKDREELSRYVPVLVNDCDDLVGAALRDENVCVCKFCGFGVDSYNPRKFYLMTRYARERLKFEDMGLEPMSSYIQFLLHPTVPFEKADMKKKTERFYVRESIRLSALHMACHYGEWESIGVLTGACLGEHIVAVGKESERSKNGMIIYQEATRMELFRLCNMCLKSMKKMTPPLATYTAPKPDHKPAETNDPTDLKAKERFEQQKIRWNRSRMTLVSIKKDLQKLIKEKKKERKRKKNLLKRMESNLFTDKDRKLINVFQYKTPEKLMDLRLKLSMPQGPYQRLKIAHLEKMEKYCTDYIQQIKADSLAYDLEDGRCHACFGLFCFTGSSGTTDSSSDGHSDVEKLKKWRYAQGMRELAPLSG